MKIRQGNNNKSRHGGNPSMIICIPQEMRQEMGLILGEEVAWRRNTGGHWELVRLVEE
jgi:hypothetical protein